jgi:hypothetical protein
VYILKIQVCGEAHEKPNPLPDALRGKFKVSLLLGYGVHTSLAPAISLLINLALRFYPASE